MADEPTIWISGRLVEKIRAHGAETYPHECCGALLGRDSGVVAGSDSSKDPLNTEREILELIAQGESNPTIARRLFLSPKTIRNHVSNIFSKLQVADRNQVIVRARKAGLGQE